MWRLLTRLRCQLGWESGYLLVGCPLVQLEFGYWAQEPYTCARWSGVRLHLGFYDGGLYEGCVAYRLSDELVVHHAPDWRGEFAAEFRP